MIVDFQHHFTPRELIKQDPGDRLIVHFDENGAPSYTIHSLLYDLEEHVAMMDVAGIDAAFLTSAAGMSASLEVSRLCNDKARQAEKDYPGRFIASAHAHPLGGKDALRELNRCAQELGTPGVVITSEMDGKFLDDPALDPFWAEAARLGLFVFVHPALKLNFSQQFDGYDTARSVGREFSLVMATIRLINSGVFDRHPNLTVHMSHLGGGLAGVLARIRGYQDKEFWGVKDNARHGRKAAKDFDYYINHNMIFDSAGFCCAIGAVNAALAEIPAERIVFATDYPQEVRQREPVRDFVNELKKLGPKGEAILSGNVSKLIKRR